jgi:hypothetical protein
MPTVAGQAIPIDMLPAGPLNQWYWLDVGPAGMVGGAQQSALMRGTGGALTWWQQRQIRGPQTAPQGQPLWLHSRPYSRGAGAFSPKFGTLPYNPIGAGVYAPYKLPVIAGPGARYNFGAIWFDVQTIGTSLQINPTIPVETVDALIATSYVGGSYITTG